MDFASIFGCFFVLHRIDFELELKPAPGVAHRSRLLCSWVLRWTNFFHVLGPIGAWRFNGIMLTKKQSDQGGDRSA